MASESTSHETTIGQYVCQICGKSYQLHFMYACYHGHHICKLCYQGQQKETGKPYSAPTSDEEAGFSCMLPHDGDAGPCYQQIGEPQMQRTRSMFPNPQIFAHQSIQHHNSLISLASIYKPSLLNIASASKKPITCPQYNCRKTIAVSALDMHFHHEHKQVATILTEVEARNNLDFDFRDLNGKICNMCLVLIHLEPTEPHPARENTTELLYRATNSRFSRSLTQRPKPFFILAAAKIPEVSNRSERPYDTLLDEDDHHVERDRVFFYLMSNVINNYTYTIAASTQNQRIRVKYFGPLLSVNEDLRKLCDEGRGLVLSPAHVDGMSSSGSTSVNLDLIIHEREDLVPTSLPVTHENSLQAVREVAAH